MTNLDARLARIEGLNDTHGGAERRDIDWLIATVRTLRDGLERLRDMAPGDEYPESILSDVERALSGDPRTR